MRCAGGLKDSSSTILPIGTITTGQYLKRDGNNIVGATPPGGSSLGAVINGGAANQATTTDSQTMYWGSMPGVAPTTTADNTRIYIPKAGTITAAYIFANSGTAGSNENWSMNIRKNNTTDTLIQTLGANTANRLWSNTGLSISVVAGDYIEIKEVQPAWGTNPANVKRACVIYLE